MGPPDGSARARKVPRARSSPHPDGSRSKGSTWTRTRNPVSASSRHEHSIVARRKHRDRSVWQRSPRATASPAQCGEACLSSRQAAGPPFTTMESRIRSPMSLRGHVWCAGESEESIAQRRVAATFYTFRRGFHTWKSTRPRRNRSAGWLCEAHPLQSWSTSLMFTGKISDNRELYPATGNLQHKLLRRHKCRWPPRSREKPRRRRYHPAWLPHMPPIGGNIASSSVAFRFLCGSPSCRPGK
jgi:hypothetical protein